MGTPNTSGLPSPPPVTTGKADPMLTKITHALIPLAVIVCATVLLALRRIDTTTALTMFSVAGVYGAGAVIASGGGKPND